MIAEHPMHTHETNLIQDEHTTEYALRMRQKCHDIRACGQDLRPGWTRDISTARNFDLIANDCCLDTGTTRDEVAKRLRHDRNNDTTRHSGRPPHSTLLLTGKLDVSDRMTTTSRERHGNCTSPSESSMATRQRPLIPTKTDYDHAL